MNLGKATKLAIGATALGAMAPEDAEAFRVYHGTGGNAFSKLDPSKAVRNYMGKGIHVSESPDLASYYAFQHSKNQRVIPLELDDSARFADRDTYLKVARSVSDDTPYLNKTGERLSWDDEIKQRLQSMGYDGVKYQHEPVYLFDDSINKMKKVDYPLSSYAIFNTNKLKNSIAEAGHATDKTVRKGKIGPEGGGISLKSAAMTAPLVSLYPTQAALAKKYKQMESDQALQDAYSPVDMVLAGATGGATMGLRAISALADPIINYAIDKLLED
jgi:hypothetical protein